MNTLTKLFLCLGWLLGWMLAINTVFTFWYVSYNAFPYGQELLNAQILCVVALIVGFIPLAYFFANSFKGYHLLGEKTTQQP